MPSKIICEFFYEIRNNLKSENLLTSSSSQTFSISSNFLSFNSLNKLKNDCWFGHSISKSLRGISWRILLNFFEEREISQWYDEIKQQEVKYEQLKQTNFPNINNIQVDPLLDETATGVWAKYYKVFLFQPSYSLFIFIHSF